MHWASLYTANPPEKHPALSSGLFRSGQVQKQSAEQTRGVPWVKLVATGASRLLEITGWACQGCLGGSDRETLNGSWHPNLPGDLWNWLFYIRRAVPDTLSRCSLGHADVLKAGAWIYEDLLEEKPSHRHGRDSDQAGTILPPLCCSSTAKIACQVPRKARAELAEEACVNTSERKMKAPVRQHLSPLPRAALWTPKNCCAAVPTETQKICLV